MELVLVESSNIKAIGYDPDLELLRVLFKEGGLYDVDHVSPEIHSALMAAKSKGGFYARYLAHLAMRAAPLPPQPETRSAPLQSYAEDDCCGKRLAKVLDKLAEADVWVCPKCGTEWKPRQVGPLRHWEPQEFFALM